MNLSIAAQALAEETAAAVADVVPAESSGLPFGLTTPEIVLLLTPLVGYAVFKAVIVPKVCQSLSEPGRRHAMHHVR